MRERGNKRPDKHDIKIFLGRCENILSQTNTKSLVDKSDFFFFLAGVECWRCVMMSRPLKDCSDDTVTLLLYRRICVSRPCRRFSSMTHRLLNILKTKILCRLYLIA